MNRGPLQEHLSLYYKALPSHHRLSQFQLHLILVLRESSSRTAEKSLSQNLSFFGRTFHFSDDIFLLQQLVSNWSQKG